MALDAAVASAPDIIYIFTDSQSSSELGSGVAQEYQESARKRECPFISVILSCHLEENIKRLTSPGRGEPSNTKLTDLGIFLTTRETEDIYHFGGPMELELDVTEATARAIAEKVYTFVRESLSSQKDLKAT